MAKILLGSDFKHDKTAFINFLSQEYKQVQKRLFKSKLLFIGLNLLTFLMSTIIVILTLFIIGKRLGSDDIIWIFTAISVISASVTFIVGIGSLFQFKKRQKLYGQQIQSLNTILNEIKQQATFDATQDVQKVIHLINDFDQEI